LPNINIKYTVVPNRQMLQSGISFADSPKEA